MSNFVSKLKRNVLLFGLSVVVWLVLMATLKACFGGVHDAPPPTNPQPSSHWEPPPPPPPPRLHLAYRFSPGVISSHDLYITNASGQALTEAHMEFTFVGENASPSLKRYWTNWGLGETQHVSIAMSDVHNVQRIEVRGRADEGEVRETVLPKE